MDLHRNQLWEVPSPYGTPSRASPLSSHAAEAHLLSVIVLEPVLDCHVNGIHSMTLREGSGYSTFSIHPPWCMDEQIHSRSLLDSTPFGLFCITFHAQGDTWQDFLPLRLDDIPLYIYMFACFIHPSMDIQFICESWLL